ncbi:DUF1643 domain-containing protein [Eudoraea sp.]|uniref:DUF1643 domain-containing protein n=1 Tax=Eudoraea sp. TaxID=1979955 RepID=UPI003C75D968
MIYKHIPDVLVKVKFSDCNKFRYQLTIENPIKTDGKSLCVIMQNPSVANVRIADKSVQFLEKLIFKKEVKLFRDVKSITIVNQFAYIQTNGFIGSPNKIGKENDSLISQAIEVSDMVLVAWGKTNAYPERQKIINAILMQYPAKQVLATKAHPSRGTYKDFIEPYTY